MRRASERGYLTLRGQRLVFAVCPISQLHPRTNVVEQSSEEIWQAKYQLYLQMYQHLAADVMQVWA
ncbi:hypothetical protein [Serratia fonticola]|uniref:hypothetical protein n=1 Tax=Serratia fonticola TaxID=47917 RepID=UPI0021B809FB|nr:hypothetical protein [Serratia fonticola]